MSKGVRNTIVIIGIIIVLFLIIFAVYQNFQTEPMDANSTRENVLQDANIGLNNMLNEILNEEVDKNVSNKTENNQNNEENTELVDNSNTENEELTEDDNRMTPREEKAIELAKKEWEENWGSLDGVSFNVSVQNNGKYGVTVYDTSTTASIKFFIVDVDTEIVTEK